MIEYSDRHNVSYTGDYTGDNEADLCKECFEEFLNWMKDEPFNDKGIYINGLGECAGVLLTHGTSG